MKNYRKRTKQNSPQIGPISGIHSTNRFKENKTNQTFYKGKGDPKLDEQNNNVEMRITGIKMIHFK